MPMPKPFGAMAALLALTTGLTGCASGSGTEMRRSMGLAAPPPDEFMVVAHGPLQPPPDFTFLPPPQLGAPSRVTPNPEADARAALLAATTSGAAASATGPATGSANAPAAASETIVFAASPSETALLAAANAESLAPIDREAIAAEAEPNERRFGLSSFLGYEIEQGDPADRLDSREEADRLRAEGVLTPTPPPLPDAPGE